jgi:hypothetical protein
MRAAVSIWMPLFFTGTGKHSGLPAFGRNCPGLGFLTAHDHGSTCDQGEAPDNESDVVDGVDVFDMRRFHNVENHINKKEAEVGEHQSTGDESQSHILPV